jgi:hypothetical protein
VHVTSLAKRPFLPQPLPAAVEQLMPTVGAELTLQERSWAHYLDTGSHFLVWAKNEHTNGDIPIGFWTVFRSDGIGDGADADGRADLGWQL